MGIGAAIGASAVIGGVASSSAAKKAASAQKNAAAQASATEQGFFDTTQENLAPFISTGTAAANKISSLEGLGGSSPGNIQATLQSLPGYQFANTQGLKSTQNSATARGLGVSGAALKGAASYSTGLANEYYNNLLSGLQNTENTGANAAGGLATSATATGAQIGNNLVGAGNAQGASDIAQGNAISGGASGVPNGLVAGTLLQNLQDQNKGTDSFYGNLPDPNSINLGSLDTNYLTADA